MAGLSLSLGLGLSAMRAAASSVVAWILATGAWNDAAPWDDTQLWKDA